MTDINIDYSGRRKNMVSAHFLVLAEHTLLYTERLVRDYVKAEDQVRLAHANELVAGARSARDAAKATFWSEFDRIFTPGDTIRYYDGWDMRVGKFEYRTDWHIHIFCGCNQGLPIVVHDSDYEKVSLA